jgi:hypothetical protein
VLLFVMANRKAANALAEPLVSQLRLIAQEPLPERNDPRFKQWKDIRTRFPAPRTGRVGYPGEDLSPPETVKAAGAWFWRPTGRLAGQLWGQLQKALTLRLRPRIQRGSPGRPGPPEPGLHA